MPLDIQIGRIKDVTHVSHLIMVYEQYWQAKHGESLSAYDRWRAVGKVLKLSKEALCRLEWIIFYEAKAKKDAALVCRHFGIGRSTFYKWLHCFDEGNLRSLETKSRRPAHVRVRAAMDCTPYTRHTFSFAAS